MQSINETSIQITATLAFLSLMPTLVVMGTSFLKISVVFSLLRNALGVQQVPPNIAIYSLSIILTVFIMAPVINDVHHNLSSTKMPDKIGDLLLQIDNNIAEPYKKFLDKNTESSQVEFFKELASKKWPKEYKEKVRDDSLLILVPAFMISELTSAFKVGLLLYLPFVAIDLIVSNVLLAMGMMMVSPMLVSLPFKILIFIMVDGWKMLSNQLVGSYS